ncbi:PREDICTED: cation/H(+) antiporter 15-like [Nelumbo nucifera]|uniref:Cation/H(+) antiporter 15-like n=2 Tax=Nelumbo nucifera TaxID=4432 RepID=A0A822ZDI6_NELNU|nr:PREDICTED: cation/H(+) antiporter 15-like [Nelumbo nucifera]DAD43182.1 TPA_asm: hypothetical protein HUJ06_001412 [Nelumbo nucifera]
MEKSIPGGDDDPRNEEFAEKYVCHFSDRITSRGIWLGDNPLHFSTPLLMTQLSLISTITHGIYIILKPLGQPMIVSQILGGIILGPSVLGKSPGFAEALFPTVGKTVLDTLSVFGFVLFIFQIGIKMDPGRVLRSGRLAFAIGTLGFLVPYAMAGSTALILKVFVAMDDDLQLLLTHIAATLSMSPFPVIAIFLAELNIHNSEVGRIATSSSIICDICSWTFRTFRFAERIATTKSVSTSIYSVLSNVTLIMVILFAIRPVALWTIRNTPEGKTVKEIYIFAFLTAVMGFGYIGEFIGQHALLTSFLLGLVIPNGPPLGDALAEKLDCFVSVLLVPMFFTICGLRTNVYAIKKLKNMWIIQSIVFVAFVGKIIGTILPPLYYKMPFRDAFSLALIMNSKGIVEVAIFNAWMDVKVLSDQSFAILIISVVLITGVVSPLVGFLYDPSKRYTAYKRRTILHNERDAELRILACVHCHENVRAIINLLEASNPTKESPIGVYVLHLVKLIGRASSLLVAYRPRKKEASRSSPSERIFKDFKSFEQNNLDMVSVHSYVGIAPYLTMHDDVCSLALEKKTSLIIMPFHKQWFYERSVQSSCVLRNLNCNVLDKAPCSVGLLINRSYLRQSKPMSDTSYHVAVLFFGGADDREALAYAERMAENPRTRLTVLRFSASDHVIYSSARSRNLDNEMLNELKHNAALSERLVFSEELVKDGAKIINIIRSMENCYDLVMVGRHHAEWQNMPGLGEWSECPEIGRIGDVLASPDFKGGSSVLVVQQQTRVWGMIESQESLNLRNNGLLVG